MTPLRKRPGMGSSATGSPARGSPRGACVRWATLAVVEPMRRGRRLRRPPA